MGRLLAVEEVVFVHRKFAKLIKVNIAYLIEFCRSIRKEVRRD